MANLEFSRGINLMDTAFKFQGNRKSGISFFSTTQQQHYSWFLLLVFILMLYVPFLGSRVVRPAGDDKVYTSQAIEMERAGTWFLQRLHDEPDYYKGPLHYILIRLGTKIFGYSMWATVWMNLVWVILGSLAVGALVHRRLREFDGWSFFAGASFAMCSAVYSHVFASQMEVGLAACYALGVYYLDRAGPGKGDIKFWLVCGLAGTLKSPLHAVLLGSSGILFWIWHGEFWERLKSLQAWTALFAGIGLCVLVYLPPFLWDYKSIWDTFVLRETFFKPANGAPWHYPIIPFFTYGMLPWTLPCFVALADGITRIWRKARNVKRTPGAKRLMHLGICLMLPTLLFFLWHPYRGQNYDTPAIAGLIILLTAIWATRAESWAQAYNFSMLLTALLFLIVPIAITVVTEHFEPMPFWWPSWLLPTIWIGGFMTFRGLFREGVSLGQVRPSSMARRCIWFFWALGSLMSVLGERELIDLRLRLEMARANFEQIKVGYWNLEKNIWNEWGYLNFMVPYPIYNLHSEVLLKKAIEEKNVILIPGQKFLDDFTVFVEKNYPGARIDSQIWRRWKTKGKNFEGTPVWRVAWDRKDLSILENHYFITRVEIPQFLNQ